MARQGHTPETLAEELGVHPFSIRRYMAGAVPQSAVVERIWEITGGKVTPNDIYGLRRGK